MLEKTAFENLQVYRLAEQLSDLSWQIVQRWGFFEKDTIGKQLVRSADSVGANIAEGSGRGSAKDNSRFAKIARGSLFEVKHWLRRAYKQKLISDSEVNEFQETLNVLTPKLSAYINFLSKKSK
jgi:four helix bundle protein